MRYYKVITPFETLYIESTFEEKGIKSIVDLIFPGYEHLSEIDNKGITKVDYSFVKH